ncbi:hypothetical protein CEUSTIGMA_g10333.t1 [Chlamydomonas eustigma]|uniref:Folate-biopterin transporter n=1 Tax=Chlamydomonas eustigma TaxID=1157962 RepID=A0A250XII7_9CHLO|nr:hypothetical protein CEUSTIGMA_g10333.t1 [Chlamydomonas eustigma]|eukprot:GAX82907.1 hypothetical protein CEUSTIGMA_g10333.t1 [Chlamydomonas eustigma]
MSSLAPSFSCCQCAPSSSDAMFYFQTSVFGFTAEFMELVQLLAYHSGLIGLVVYQLLLVNQPIRTLLFWCAVLGILLNASQLLLVARLSAWLGIPDAVMVLPGDSSLLRVISDVMITPVLAVAARACPQGAEATLYSTIYMVLNVFKGLASLLGTMLTYMMGITQTHFTGMTWLLIICNMCLFMPLPLLCWLPGFVEQPLVTSVVDSQDSVRSVREVNWSSCGRRGS